MLLATLSLLTGLMLLMTFITLWRYEAWWVRGWDFPRLQLAILAVFLLVLDLALLDFSRSVSWWLVVLDIICISYQVWWILPYTRLFPFEVSDVVQDDPPNSIAIMAANVLMTNKNAPALLKLVREYQPDILVTLESNTWWQNQLDQLAGDYPYIIQCPLENLYGMHVYSKLPLDDAKLRFLVEPDVPSMHAIVILPSGTKVRVHFLHPAPPSPTENDESIERDAELLVVAKNVADETLPVIVAGDLNDVAWSATTRLFRKISGLLDPRVGRGMYNSFHAGQPLVRWPLDHLFHSKHFVLVDVQRLPSIGSDHFPMFIKLVYIPEEGAEQEGLQASPEEEHWADEKIATQAVGNI